MNSPEIKLTYEERQAVPIIRKLLKRKPEAAALVFEGMAKESAVNILLQAKKELDDMLAVSQAISEAAGAIAKLDQPKEQS
ncbi:MAG: hypothetical protein ACKO0Z_01860 [Betaproteobacteria bacterium]